MGLVAPESQVLGASTVISYINSMRSLARYNLRSYRYGVGEDDESSADLSLLPPGTMNSEEVIDFVDLLLTNGRLSKDMKPIIESTYLDVLSSEGHEVAFRHVLQIFFAVPEFQISNIHGQLPTGVAHETTTPFSVPETLHKPKTVVYLQLDGGADSFVSSGP